jgi:hypothetical protein
LHTNPDKQASLNCNLDIPCFYTYLYLHDRKSCDAFQKLLGPDDGVSPRRLAELDGDLQLVADFPLCGLGRIQSTHPSFENNSPMGQAYFGKKKANY